MYRDSKGQRLKQYHIFGKYLISILQIIKYKKKKKPKVMNANIVD